MKFLLQLCVLVMALPALAQEQQFVLKGSLPPSSKKWTVLLYWNEGASAEEAKLVNGKFEIKGTIEEPVKATLVLQEVNPPRDKKFDFNEMQANRLELFLEGGNITVTSTGRLAYAVVQGPPAVQDYYNFQQQARHLQPLEAGMMSMMNHYTRQKRTDVLARNFEKLLDAYIGFYFEEQQVFMRKQPASPVSFYFVKQAVQSGLDPAKATTLFGLLSPGLQTSVQGQELAQELELSRRSMVGAVAPDFTQPDPEGKPVSLSSFRGKYVLVDFWASWCGPCRVESPNLVKAYQQYKQKNFEIFGVSLDQNREKWLKAVKDDGYTWQQVGDMKGWENEAASMYGVKGIPFNILLDPNGVVIARNLRGDELEKKLKEIFP